MKNKELVLMCALRYVLPRKYYAVDAVSETIAVDAVCETIKNEELSEGCKEVMIKYIDEQENAVKPISELKKKLEQ